MCEDESKINYAMIIAAMESVANHCIIPAQDYLGLGTEARVNMPSTVGNNWKWRLKKDAFTPELVAYMAKLAKLYGRYNETK